MKPYAAIQVVGGGSEVGSGFPVPEQHCNLEGIQVDELRTSTCISFEEIKKSPKQWKLEQAEKLFSRSLHEVFPERSIDDLEKILQEREDLFQELECFMYDLWDGQLEVCISDLLQKHYIVGGIAVERKVYHELRYQLADTYIYHKDNIMRFGLCSVNLLDDENAFLRRTYRFMDKRLVITLGRTMKVVAIEKYLNFMVARKNKKFSCERSVGIQKDSLYQMDYGGFKEIPTIREMINNVSHIDRNPSNDENYFLRSKRQRSERVSPRTRRKYDAAWNYTSAYIQVPLYSRHHNVREGKHEVKGIRVDSRLSNEMVEIYSKLFKISPYRAAHEIVEIFSLEFVLVRGLMNLKLHKLQHFLENVLYSVIKRKHHYTKEYRSKLVFLINQYQRIGKTISYEIFRFKEMDFFHEAVSTMRRIDCRETVHRLRDNEFYRQRMFDPRLDRAEAQSGIGPFLDFFKNGFNTFSMISTVTTTASCVKVAVETRAKEFCSLIGIDFNSGIFYKSILGIFVLAITGGLIYMCRLATQTVLAICNILLGFCLDKEPLPYSTITVHITAVAEAQSTGTFLATLLCMLTCYLTGTTKTWNFEKAGSAYGSFSRFTEALSKHLPDVIDKVLDYFNFPSLFRDKNVVELYQTAKEIETFVTTERITSLVATVKEKALECMSLYKKSCLMRQALICLLEKEGKNYVATFRSQLAVLDKLFEKALTCSEIVHDRMTPIFLYLYGDPGVGKTTMIDYLASCWYDIAKDIKSKDSRYTDQFADPHYSAHHMFPRKANTDFWEGYEGQPLVFYNECFSEVDPDIRVKTAAEFLNAIESSAYPLDRAFDQKGFSYFTSEMVIATSNMIDFHNCGLSSASALQRRIHFPLKCFRGEELKADLSNLDNAWYFESFVTPGEVRSYSGVSKYFPKGRFNFKQLCRAVIKEYLDRVDKPSHQSRAKLVPWKTFIKNEDDDARTLKPTDRIYDALFGNDKDSGIAVPHDGSLVDKYRVSLGLMAYDDWFKKWSEKKLVHEFSEKLSEPVPALSNLLSAFRSGDYLPNDCIAKFWVPRLHAFQNPLDQLYLDKKEIMKEFGDNWDIGVAVETFQLSLKKSIGTWKDMAEGQMFGYLKSLVFGVKNDFEQYSTALDSSSEPDDSSSDSYGSDDEIFEPDRYDEIRQDPDGCPIWHGNYDIESEEFEEPKLTQLEHDCIEFGANLSVDLAREREDFLDYIYSRAKHVKTFGSLVARKNLEQLNTVKRHIEETIAARKRAQEKESESMMSPNGSYSVFGTLRDSLSGFASIADVVKSRLSTMFSTIMSKSAFQLFFSVMLGCGSMALGFLIERGIKKLLTKVYDLFSGYMSSTGSVKPLSEFATYIDDSRAEGNSHGKGQKVIKSSRYRPVRTRLLHKVRAEGNSYGNQLVNISTKLLDNVRLCTFKNDKYLNETMVLFADNLNIIVPGHACKSIKWTQMDLFDMQGNKFASYTPDQFEIYDADGGRDLCFFRIKGVQVDGISSIIKYMTSRPVLYGQSCTRLGWMMVDDQEGAIRTTESFLEFNFSESALDSGVTTEAGTYVSTLHKYYVIPGANGAPGMCSSPVISTDTKDYNECLIGVHIARLGQDAIVAPIFKSDFKICAEGNCFVSEEDCFDLTKQRDGFPGAMPYYVEKMPIVFADKNEFVKSSIFEALPEFNSKVAPAVLDYDAYDLWREKLSKFDRTPKPEILTYLEDHPDTLFRLYAPRDLKYVYRMLTIEEAAFGTDDGTIDPMDLSTSSGYHSRMRSHPKRKNLIRKEDRYIDEGIRKEVEFKIHMMKRGNCYPQVVKDNLKSELRPKDRVDAKKTRVFCVGNLVDFLVCKMVFGHVVAHLKAHRHNHTVAIGTNVHDYDWKFIYNKIFKFGRDRVIGGDLESMDISTQRFMADCFLKFYVYYIAELSINRGLYNLFKAAIFNICTTVHVAPWGAYLYPMGNSSGNYKTGSFNSFCTDVYLTCCYYYLRPDNCNIEIWDALSIMVYGDDNLGSVSKEIDWFNNQTIAACMKKLFNVAFTLPDKSQITEPFLKEEDQVFLSRRWINEGYKAPLELDSIYGMLCYIRHHADIPDNTMLIQNIDTACLELTHYDESSEIEHRNRIQRSLIESGVNYTLKSSEHFHKMRLSQYSDSFNSY